MQEKKLSKAQLEAIIKDEVFTVRGKKRSKFVYLTDRGISLTIADGFAIVSTNFYRGIFNEVTGQGYSKPYLYVDMFVNMVHKYAYKTNKYAKNPNEVSFSELLSCELEPEDKALLEKVDKWFTILIEPVYAIGETPVEDLSRFMMHCSLIAKQNAMLNTTNGDIMFNGLFNEYISNLRYIAACSYAPENLKLLPIVKEIETEAMDKVHKYITDNGGEINDVVVLPAAPDEIVEAFNELKDNPNK